MILLVHFAPLEISSVQGFDQKLGSGKVCGHGNVVHITEPDYIIDIRLMPLGIERVAKEDQQIDLILLNLGADLLHTAQMSGQMLVNVEVRHFLDQSSGRARRIELMAAQDTTVSNTEVLHKFFLGIVCD